MPTYLTIAHVHDYTSSPRRSKTIECLMDFDEPAVDVAKHLNMKAYESQLWRDYRFRLQMYAILSTDPSHDDDSVTMSRKNPHQLLLRFEIHPTTASEALKYFQHFLPEHEPDHVIVRLDPGDDDATDQRNHELLKRRS